MVDSQLRTLPEVLPTSFILALEWFFIRVDVRMLPQILLTGKPLVAILTKEVADIEVPGVDVALEIELRVVALVAVGIETGVVVVVHFACLTFLLPVC